MLSASQWTSRNLIKNCNGVEGPTGPSGPDGPNGPEGQGGIPGESGIPGRNDIGRRGREGVEGEMGTELPLYVGRIDAIDSQTIILRLSSKYALIYNYLVNETATPSPIRTTNIRFQADPDLSSYTGSDYWVRIKFMNYTFARGGDHNIVVNILLNTSTTPAASFDVYPAWDTPFTQTMYIRWDPSRSRLVIY